ncbi:MAG: hypothetical protein M1838_006129 [Thelocarpon superellum]|nr:MAG: hypothetical protein M1838_006129 [Thelocarpon superellum]
MAHDATKAQSISALHYSKQADRLSGHSRDADEVGSTTAVEARFVTPHDPVIETADGGRLPSVPLGEAQKLNRLKNAAEGKDVRGQERQMAASEEPLVPAAAEDSESLDPSLEPSATLRTVAPPSRTNPLFPPLPLYGPPSWLRNVQCTGFRVSSFFLSLTFLGVIVLGAAFTSLPLMGQHIGIRLQGRDPNARRPFYEEEARRKAARHAADKAWKRQTRRRNSGTRPSEARLGDDSEEEVGKDDGFVPTEGGKDPIICDVGYYARRVGLDVEEYRVQTEDGFILQLWHVYDPREYRARSAEHRDHRGPHLFHDASGEQATPAPGADLSPLSSPTPTPPSKPARKPRYPVLLIHGLLQSAGAYCTNDDQSLAFFLCKSGYDVWLGNNRCGFAPEHTLLKYSDPRMWAWNIRQMGVLDLPALMSRVLAETGFAKLGLVCHSQGTTETFVALAKGQRPDLGQQISVFCALAPAVYAGPLIGKAYFKFMRVISPGFFRIIFGIHAFIPFMMAMHRLLPGRLYGALGYRVFSFLFNWTDDRWEQDLRDRMFQFAPVYVSAESMRWWLGRECFAKHKCILATKEEARQEDEEDAADGHADDEDEDDRDVSPDAMLPTKGSGEGGPAPTRLPSSEARGARAWYDERAPPFALWVAGNDALVDGRRLLRRFEKGREPHVQVVHAKVIEEYEHLDVLWAMDAIEQVGKEVREVLWKTIPPELVDVCRVPRGCGTLERVVTRDSSDASPR